MSAASAFRVSRAASRSWAAFEILAAALSFPDSTSVFESASSPLRISVIFPLTVEKNASLILVSSELAPVSVIFGLTGPSFSFTR